MTHPMLEKVARAMWDDVERRAVDNDPQRKGTVGWSSAPEDFVDKYRGMARAAVQALLELDSGMIMLGADHHPYAASDPEGAWAETVAAYRAMLLPLVEGEVE